MTGYIIGVVIGIIIFLLQNLKPTSIGFRILFLLLSIAFIWGIFYAHLGYWNILIIPIGEIALCFISAVCFPYGGKAATIEYEAINGENYYANLRDDDKIGNIQPPGFKQTYDRIMEGIIFKIVSTQNEFQYFRNLIYSKNFYPISIHTKAEVVQHLHSCIEKAANSSINGNTIRTKANERIELLFNTFVSLMSIHEEATRNLEEISERHA